MIKIIPTIINDKPHISDRNIQCPLNCTSFARELSRTHSYFHITAFSWLQQLYSEKSPTLQVPRIKIPENFRRVRAASGISKQKPRGQCVWQKRCFALVIVEFLARLMEHAINSPFSRCREMQKIQREMSEQLWHCRPLLRAGYAFKKKQRTGEILA